MTLGERIKSCRQKAGLSQEKLAELAGVSRQAVTKWEAGQSAPSTENLLKLAGIFGTTAGLLLAPENEERPSVAAELFHLQKEEEEKRRAARRRRLKENTLAAALAAAGYLAVYLAGRIIWCSGPEASITGWLFSAKPSGEHSYLYGWLLSSGLFWWAMAITVIPALFGKRGFSCAAFAGFVLGLLLGIAFGPNPEGAAYGHGDYGWAVWGGSFLLSIAAGVVTECCRSRSRRRSESQ